MSISVSTSTRPRFIIGRRLCPPATTREPPSPARSASAASASVDARSYRNGLTYTPLRSGEVVQRGPEPLGELLQLRGVEDQRWGDVNRSGRERAGHDSRAPA